MTSIIPSTPRPRKIDGEVCIPDELVLPDSNTLAAGEESLMRRAFEEW
jgi:hypothetical protein